MRTFLALEPDAGSREALLALQQRNVAALPSWRAIRAAQLHLTLCFFGETTAQQRDTIAARIDTQPQFAAIVAQLQHWLPLPRARQARVLAIQLDAEALPALAADWESIARTLGFSTEPRPFLAHLTLFRARAPQRVDIATLSPATMTLRFEALTLFESVNDREGVRYDALARRMLG